MPTQNIVILGTGGNCIDILDTLCAINASAGEARFRCAGFLDDDPAKQGTTILDAPVLGGLECARTLTEVKFVNGIGSPQNFWRKREIIARTGLCDEQFVTLVHPSAQISPLATLGTGTVVLQNSVIAARAAVGRHVMILALCVVSHDSAIGDYSTLANSACISGNVRAGEACYFGGHCSVREGLVIGDFVLCGMGSNILDDVPADSVMVGNPAHRLRGVTKG
ncbi:MAG: NeuD/PglB/VioB family sugar acetyltransferase [Betaproteobacteria bacterium]